MHLPSVAQTTDVIASTSPEQLLDGAPKICVRLAPYCSSLCRIAAIPRVGPRDVHVSDKRLASRRARCTLSIEVRDATTTSTRLIYQILLSMEAAAAPTSNDGPIVKSSGAVVATTRTSQRAAVRETLIARG